MLLKLTTSFKYNKEPFWIFWQGITCLLVGYLVIFSNITGVTQGLTIPAIQLNYNPTKLASVSYYQPTDLNVSIIAPSSQCQFSYKSYKSPIWLPLPTTNNNPCQTTLTKSMRANNLVIDIKAVITNSTQSQTLTDSYVFKSL